MRKLDPKIINSLPFFVIICGLFIIYSAVVKNRHVGKENTAYVRVLNCIISKNAVGRTQKDIEHCYQVIQGEFHVPLTRYDRL
jgi:hypothetical protein